MYEKFRTAVDFKNKTLWLILFFSFCFHIFLAAYFPMTNDEVYYWDWSRQLQLSYVDAPPFVAWLAALGRFFFHGSLGARFFVVIANFLSIIFLLLSLQLLFKNKSEFKLIHAILLCLLSVVIPIFNFESFMLLPDASLMFAISGALYAFLRSIRYYDQNRLRHSLVSSLFLGFFLGVGFLSKYQIIPIAFGFLLGFGWYCGIRHGRFLIQYYLIVFFVSLIVSSPVFIWNAQNNWSSFQFQTEHGFKGFHLQLRPLLIYLLGITAFLLPWYLYQFFKLIIVSITKIMKSKDIAIVFILPFVFLFFLILLSALGKQALPHWSMPAFFLLLPLLVKESATNIEKNKKFWCRVHLISLTCVLLISILPCLSIVQKNIPSILYTLNIKSTDLNQFFLWSQLQSDLKNNHGIDIQSFPYEESSPTCKDQKYPYLASTRWYWTAQIAFHFKNQPRVFYFNSKRNSYYNWRDQLKDFKGCQFVVITDGAHFNKEELQKIIKIESIQKISSTKNAFWNMYVVYGTI